MRFRVHLSPGCHGSQTLSLTKYCQSHVMLLTICPIVTYKTFDSIGSAFGNVGEVVYYNVLSHARYLLYGILILHIHRYVPSNAGGQMSKQRKIHIYNLFIHNRKEKLMYTYGSIDKFKMTSN